MNDFKPTVYKVNIFKKIIKFLKGRSEKNIPKVVVEKDFEKTSKKEQKDFLNDINGMSQKEIEELDSEIEKDITLICFASKKELKELKDYYDEKTKYMQKIIANSAN